MSQLVTSGGQSTRTSASVLPMNIQGWFPLGLTGSPCNPRDCQECSPAPQLESISSLVLRLLCGQFSHPYMTPGKTIALTIWTFVGEVMSLLFNRLSRFVIAFLPRNKRLLISWLQSPSAVMLEPKKIKSVTVSTFSPFTCHEVRGPGAIIFSFLSVEF